MGTGSEKGVAGGTGMTRDEAWKLASHWVAAWNAHDLELIPTHYA
jgi:hypothetical protein